MRSTLHQSLAANGKGKMGEFTSLVLYHSKNNTCPSTSMENAVYLRELTEHALMSWHPHNSLPLSKSVDWNTPPPSLLWNISVQNKVSTIL
jgi:hypothetical protein